MLRSSSLSISWRASALSGIGHLDEDEYGEVLAEWRADRKPLDPAEVFPMAAGFNP